MVEVVEPRVVGVAPVVAVEPTVGTVAGLVVSVVPPRAVLDVLGTGSATVVDAFPSVVDGDPKVVVVCCRRTDSPDDLLVLSAQLLRVSAAAMAAISTANTVTASTP